MLDYEEWFNWAPNTNLLGYIQGFNRMAIENKELKVTQIETNSTSSNFTPKRYVDRDLVWQTDDTIFVSRSKKVNG